MASIITFVNNLDEESGKTMSLVAIATYMAINYNEKILVISTTNKEDKIKSCYFEEKEVKRLRMGIFGERRPTIDVESGIEGITKMLRSNKLTPEIITNYTKVVFKDRLEILLGYKGKENQSNDIQEAEIADKYPELISIARMHYDRVFVDLDNNLGEEIKQKIIDTSDLLVVNTSQNLNSLKKLKEKKENDAILQSKKTLMLIGRYDKFSTYNIKNVTRFLNEKKQILTIPYNTLFFESANEANVPDLFLRLQRVSDSEERNMFFLQEVKRATESIIYRLQELQAMM